MTTLLIERGNWGIDTERMPHEDESRDSSDTSESKG